MVEHLRQPSHDRKAKPQAARRALRRLEPQELLEDGLTTFRGHTKPRVVDLDAMRIAAPTNADHDSAGR